MKLLFKKYIFLSVIAFGGCSTTSQTAQMLFTPDHYDPPRVYTDDKKLSDKDGLLIEIGANKSFKLNANHTDVKVFKDRSDMRNDKFIQLAYLYLIAAESQCEGRVSDINRSRTASNSGFGMLTTLSAVAGSAIGNASGANVASGAAAVFNSLTTNANAFQTQIASQYSGNIATVIVKKQSEMVQGKKYSGTRSISQLLDDLAKKNKFRSDISLQSKIYYELLKLNRACTVSAGQREIGDKLSGVN